MINGWPLRSSHRHKRRVPGEPPFDVLQPLERGPAIGIHVGQDVSGRGEPRGFPRHHEPRVRLVQHADARNTARQGACLIGARVVDNDDLVWRPGLRQQGMQALVDPTF